MNDESIQYVAPSAVHNDAPSHSRGKHYVYGKQSVPGVTGACTCAGGRGCGRRGGPSGPPTRRPPPPPPRPVKLTRGRARTARGLPPGSDPAPPGRRRAGGRPSGRGRGPRCADATRSARSRPSRKRSTRTATRPASPARRPRHAGGGPRGCAPPSPRTPAEALTVPRRPRARRAARAWCRPTCTAGTPEAAAVRGPDPHLSVLNKI